VPKGSQNIAESYRERSTVRSRVRPRFDTLNTVGDDNRRLWSEWVGANIGGDATRQRLGLEAALQSLAAGQSSGEATEAARRAVGAASAQPPPYGQPGPVRCRFCGSMPAVPMTIYEHNGYVILMQFKNLRGPFCRMCGLNVWRRMTDSTLLRGWLGVFSFFIAPVTALINVVNLRKLTSLGAPDPSTSVRPPADPGRGMFQRLGVYVYAVVIVVVLVLFLLPAIAGR